jgi:hypothetical protein
LIITLGDTCEPQARADMLNVPTGHLLFPETLLTENDKGCNNLLGNYITRTDKEFDYGNYKVMQTQHGILVDTLVSGNQYYKYTRSNPNASNDGFYYYFKNNSTGRTTKAWVRLSF